MKYLILFVVSLLFAIGALLTGVLRMSETEKIGEWKLLADTELLHGTRISKVKFFDYKNGIAISPGAIAKTYDGGEQWRYVHFAAAYGYNSFAFADSLRGVVVGSVENELPLILRTIDGGESWHVLDFDPTLLNRADKTIKVFLDVCLDPIGTIWIVGDRGIIRAAAEESKLNVSSVHPTANELSSVACDQNGDIWAAGGNIVFANRGNGWERKILDSKYRIRKVTLIGKEVWLLGGIQTEADSELGSGLVLRSMDSGDNWENKTPNSANLQFDIFQNDGILWLSGERGQIHYSRDDGGTWMKSNCPSSADLFSIFFIDDRSGWIVGDRGTILAYDR